MMSLENLPESDLHSEQNILTDLVKLGKAENSGDNGEKLTKKQMKRLQRHQHWIANKVERKKREKLKRKEKIEKLLSSGQVIVSRKQLKKDLVRLKDSKCKVSVVIDCDYADMMNSMELKKLCKQLNRCYSTNKHSQCPVQLYITSLSGIVRQQMEQYQQGFVNWDANCTEKHWTEMFQDEDKLNKNIIYLTGDSPNNIPDTSTIQQQNSNIFIIGGLIDHNRHKEAALEIAKKYQVKHGQLPIREHIQMAHRRILAIPHVFEIMLYASNGTNGSNWNEIFQKVIPIRKLQNKCDDEIK